MASYYMQSLEHDMPAQFKDRKNIGVMLGALGKQLDDLREFFESLLIRFDLNALSGNQLDLIGDIVVLSRKEAGLLMGDISGVDILSDEEYRIMLMYKMLLNTSTCTYQDLINGIQYFLDPGEISEIVFIERADDPAKFILQCDYKAVEKLSKLQYIHAGGVGVVLEAVGRDIDAHFIPYFAYWVDDDVDAMSHRFNITNEIAYVRCISGLNISVGDSLYIYTSGANTSLYSNTSGSNKSQVTGFQFAQAVSRTTGNEFVKITAR